jgi:hypothetical protein
MRVCKVEEYWICTKDVIEEESMFRKRHKRYVFRPIMKIDDGNKIRLNKIKSGNSYSEYIVFVTKKSIKL